MATPTTLPATFVAGDVLTAAQMNNLRGAFRVLQVVTALSSTPVSNSTTVAADTTLTATITPQSNTSKILVMVSQNGLAKSAANANNNLYIQLLRGGSFIADVAKSILFTGSSLVLTGAASLSYLDSPATTSATTYKTQFYNGFNGASVTVQNDNGASTMVLMEISA
jgi:hypothetical protein